MTRHKTSATLCLLAFFTAGLSGAFASEIPQPTSNNLQSREYPLGPTGVIVDPHSASLVRQYTTAWQFTGGTWNGQSLAGISLVLVQDIPDELAGLPAAHHITAYVSDFATPAQRDAAVEAMLAQHPELLASRPGLRVEPAIIQIEQSADHKLILHLALFA